MSNTVELDDAEPTADQGTRISPVLNRGADTVK